MDSVFASASKKSTATYTGPLDFLEDHNQSVFNTIFGTRPIPLVLLATKRNNALEDALTVRDQVNVFVSLSNLLIFCDIIQHRYVGSTYFDKTQIISDVKTELSRLKLEVRVHGQVQLISPDELFCQFQDFILLLPNDAHKWSFHLVVCSSTHYPVRRKRWCYRKGTHFRGLVVCTLRSFSNRSWIFFGKKR